MTADIPGAGRGDEVREKLGRYLLPATATYYSEKLVPVAASGSRVTDAEGRSYLDFFGGILTISLGHGHEEVTGVIQAQAARLGHVSSLYPTLPVVELAERLAEITPGDLQKSYFVASGTEAVETAVVLAQVCRQALEIVALRHGYSGRSILAQNLTGHAPWRAVPSQVAGVKHAPSPYCYRCPLKKTYPDCDVACARDLEELIRTQTTGAPAAFLAEPIAGVGGFITPPDEYFEVAVEIVRRHGGLFICDEVQTGFGRTGKLFAIEHYGVQPDIMTLAKGIANGMPIAATIATPEVADAFKALTISTFGGSTVSAAAANATIDVMRRDDVPANAARRGERLMEGLRRIQRDHPAVLGEVRGKGLMIGLELVEDETVGNRTPNVAAMGRLMEETKRRGLLIGKGGLYGNVVRLGPPLTISEAEVDEALEILAASFGALSSA